ncbi:hypothetical protein [Litorihabitans aurantiacus]|uniref:hypothetical protein n=1 Tax=Litorihabitans aurantiacus TaxID=1930061 RepID=UPI0024E0AFC0|nr:hypothetical protein [Litorihabitans aurantiacus]
MLAAVLARVLPLTISRPVIARATGATEADVHAALDELAVRGLLSEHRGRYTLGPQADAAILAALAPTTHTHPEPEEISRMTNQTATPAEANR